MKRLLLAAFLASVSAPALAQTSPTTQCVASAYAGGTSDAITIAALPCALTTNLLILTTNYANTTTAPTLQPLGLPAQPITRANGASLALGDLAANGRALLVPTGSSWLLFNPNTIVAGTVSGPGSTTIGDLALWGNGTGTGLTDSGLSSGAKTALGVAVGSAGAVVVNGGVGGTPSSITLTYGSGLPIGGLTGLGASVGTGLAAAGNAVGGFPILNASGYVGQSQLQPAAATASTVATPTAPASTSAYAMQGLAGAITPTRSGKIVVTISGTVVAYVATTVDNGITYQISYGTGTAPANAAALTGTQIGLPQTYTSATAPTAFGDVNVPFSTSYVISGLTPGTPYWLDLAAKSITTASQMGLSNVSIVAVEQ